MSFADPVPGRSDYSRFVPIGVGEPKDDEHEKEVEPEPRRLRDTNARQRFIHGEALAMVAASSLERTRIRFDGLLVLSEDQDSGTFMDKIRKQKGEQRKTKAMAKREKRSEAKTEAYLTDGKSWRPINAQARSYLAFLRSLAEAGWRNFNTDCQS